MKSSLLKILFGAIVGAFIVLQFKGCNGNNGSDIYKTVSTVTKTHHSDTAFKHHVDTVYVMSDPVYIYRNVPSKITDIDDSIKEYQYEYNLSDLKARVSTRTTGEIIDQDMQYSVICPIVTVTDTLIMTNTDSIIVNTDNFIEKNKANFFIGTEIGASNSLVNSIAFNATLQFKNKYQVYYEYGMFFDQEVIPNQHRVGVKIPIRFKKQ
jgi:hypothetical protein